MELSKTRLYNAIQDPRVGPEEVWRIANNYVNNRKDINLRDSSSGETFMHALVDCVVKFSSAVGVTVVYLVATSGIDLDVRDGNGDTCLHRAVRAPGSHRVVVALIRCGVDVSLTDQSGKTAEDILRQDNPPGWDETLHWFNSFKPGLRGLLSQPHVDLARVSTLLKGWCRTVYNVEGRDVRLVAQYENKPNRHQLLLQHEYANEFALAMLAGNCQRAEQLLDDSEGDIDINIKDHLYEGLYPDFPTAPRPLLAALWEADSEECVDLLLSRGVDTSVLFSPHNDTTEMEPLFFHLLCKEDRPRDTIAHKILIESNMAARNQNGQTILFKAIANDYSNQFIKALFKYGVDVAARDRKGRTARDFAELLRKSKYLHVIDEHVVNIVKDSNLERLTALVMQGYDHILDLTDNRGFNLTAMIKEHPCSVAKEVLQMLDKLGPIQEHLEQLFKAVDSGSLKDVKRLISRKFATAQDRCGRSALHRGILAKTKPVLRFLIDEYPHILNIQDNLGRTVLHYAYLILEGESLVHFLIDRGADDTIVDVAGKTPRDYRCQECGQRAYLQLRHDVQGQSMEVFLSETNFERSLERAIKKGDLSRVKSLVEGVKERGDINRYNSTLFHCIDSGRQNIAVYLIKMGMRTDIYKQYQKCSPNSSACAMYACDHSVTSFKDRARELDCHAVLETMDEVALDKSKGGTITQQTVKPSVMEEFTLLGLL